MNSSRSILPITAPSYLSILQTSTPSSEDIAITARRTPPSSSNKACGCLGALLPNSLRSFSNFGRFVTKKFQGTNTVHDASPPVDQRALTDMMRKLHELPLEELVALSQSLAHRAGVSNSPEAAYKLPVASSLPSLPSFAKTSKMPLQLVSDADEGEGSEIRVVHEFPRVVANKPSSTISFRPLGLGRLPDIEQSRRYYGENEERACALMDANSDACKVLKRFEKQRADNNSNNDSDPAVKKALQDTLIKCLNSLKSAEEPFSDEQINTHFEKLERLEGEANKRLAALKLNTEQLQAPADQIGNAVKLWETQLFCVEENKRMMMAMLKQIELKNIYKNEIDKQLTEIEIEIGKPHHLNADQPAASSFYKNSLPLSWL